MFEPQKRNETLAAEGQIETRPEGAVAVNAEAEAVGDIELTEPEILPVRGDLAGVDEHGAVERPPRLPPVFGREQDAVAIPEAELAKAPQHLRATQCGFEVERDVLASTRIGQGRCGMERNRPILVRNRHVVLQI